ncbi:thyroid transcription factor 1-associated protein 26 [Rhineura floridana]|uniref:thyroid transcription factor 1-associated protein 26 n=1 Tax=Rhineura floridana TaxID=261503 RepID=UPI002AC806A1|nr:thyroid transcription factor 1-associated protein 26 [Rhineura floridana]
MTYSARDETQQSGWLMAPEAKNKVSPSSKKDEGTEKSRARPGRKRPWRKDPRLVRGSIREGQGFAFWRKQKIQRDYKKLIKKESHASSQNNTGFKEDYPEHLKHLYLAEEEMLKKQRKPKNDRPFILEEKKTAATQCNMMQRKFKTKTSNQKAKEEYEKIKAEQDKKKEEARKRQEERGKAQKLYKQKKMETYKILSKKTRKGQPNLNLQVEYLLQKIQKNP